ncbi:6704_t:CDS:2, partial [Diversispora eburnea]
DTFHDQEDYYTNYARGQIVDRRLEEPWLESDLSRKDPTHSQSVLNLRYHGSRGQVVDPIRHPELSLGFLGNDPRGNQVGPDINKISKQMQRRKTVLTIGIGTNADTQVSERPWTEQAIRIGCKEIHNQLKGNTHVFFTQREGKINEVVPPSETNYAGYTIMRNPEEWQKILSGGDYYPYNELIRKYTNSGNNAPSYVPWRHVMGETKLPVQKYGKQYGNTTGLHITPSKDKNIMLQKADQSWNLQQDANTTGLHITPSKDRNIMLQKSDQSWGLQQDVNETRHISFNMYMVLATKEMVQTETGFGQNKNFQLTKPGGASLMPAMHSREQKWDQQLVLPSGFEKSISKNNRKLIPSSDPYPISEIQCEKQQRHLSLQGLTSLAKTFRRPILTSDTYPISEMQHEEQKRHLLLQDVTSHIGTLRKPILPDDLEFLYWQQQEEQNRDVASSSQESHLTKGVLSAIYPEKRHLATSERSAPSQKNPTFSHKQEFIWHLNQVLPKSAGADNFNIHVYSSAPPQVSTERSNPDILCHIGDVTILGNSEETVFGSNASGGYSTATTGPKTLRIYKESDSMNLHDGL